MTKAETSRLMGCVSAVYPLVDRDRDPQFLVDIWQRVFADTPAALVERAASRGIYYSGAEFAKLPPEVQQIVGSPGQLCEWSQMNRHDFYAVVENGFKRSWRARHEHEWEKKYFLPAQNQEKLPGK